MAHFTAASRAADRHHSQSVININIYIVLSLTMDLEHY